MNLTGTNGSIFPASLVASAIIGFLAILGLVILPITTRTVADMRIEPIAKVVQPGDIFAVAVVVEASVPVNVFAGKLTFDTNTLAVQSIDYNTSIADLWAEEPWYSNGDGTLSFIGGTTRAGGFTGADTLITITFKALSEGAGTLSIGDASILQHDGLGTMATLAQPIDALFTVEAQTASTSPANLLSSASHSSTYSVVAALPSSDLNSDGRVTITDASILLLNIGSNNTRYDLNGDTFVDLKDFNIVISAM